jgi:hypothetical protein
MPGTKHSVGLSKGKCTSREMFYLLRMSIDLQKLFADVTHLAEGLNLETLLTLKGKSP